MSDVHARDEHIVIDGLRFHYLDWGGEARRVLLLLHGLTSNVHAWAPFVERGFIAPDEYRILALDQRGHGDTDHSRDYTIGAFASDIHSFARRLGLEEYNLMGHSMGARNAMAYAGDHWDSLRRLVLVDFGPEMARQGAVEVKTRVTQRPAGFRTIDQAVSFMREMTPDRSEEELRYGAEHALRLNYAGRLVWKHDQELQWISGAFGLTEVPYLWQQLARIQCPTLVVRGETSNVLDREGVERMLAALPAGKAVEIAGASHAVPQDRPVEFWNAVHEFLE
jgi:pimeloyl-ACP methyl ester carboxylesterase